MLKTLATIIVLAFLGGLSGLAQSDRYPALTKAGTDMVRDQPNMGIAYVALDLALESLRKAEADKGGHRVKAVSLTETARTEVQQGIEIGKKN